MSDMADDELLGGEDEIDDIYDITNEREEALLQEEEEYSKGRDAYDERKKSDSYSENDDQDDVLNLDVEEDFQDEDKLLYDDDDEEEPPHKKNDTQASVEKTQNLKQNVTPVTKTTANTVQTVIKSVPQKNNSYSAPQRINSGKKNGIQNDKRKRGNNRNFQTRTNFAKNKMQRRRNGTVLINPRYEGTVHVNENDARLAWKNPQCSQNNNSNFVQPWNSESMLQNCGVNLQNQLLVSNLVTGIANSFAQTQGNMLMSSQSQPQNQHFFQPPPHYEQPLSYEPPPTITGDRHSYPSYNHQSRVTTQVHRPPIQQSYARQIEPPFNSQMSTNRLQAGTKTYDSHSTYNRYDRTSTQNMGPTKNSNVTHSYQSSNLNYNKYNNTRPSTYNSNYYPPQIGDNNYDRKKINYSNYPPKQENYNNYNSGNYAARNDVSTRNENYYRQEFQQNQSYSDNNKFQNNPSQQGQFKQRENANIPSQNFQQGYRRTNNDCAVIKDELPQKKAKVDEEKTQNSAKVSEKPEKVSITESIQRKNDNQVTQQEGEEDEDTRLYRLKIEEQKRERERVLRIKEDRRRQKMLQGQNEEQQELQTADSEGHKQNPLKQNFQKINTINQCIKTDNVEHSVGTIPVQKVNRVTLGSVPNVIQRLGGFPQRQISRQNQTSTLSSISSYYPQHSTNYSGNSNSDLPPEFPNLTFKVSNDRQSNVPTSKDGQKKMPNITFKVTNTVTSSKELPKTEASSSSFMSNRVVVVKSKSHVKNEISTNSDVSKPETYEASNESSDAGHGRSSFFNNRKVLKKDNNLLNTKLVVVNNLSATINQNKLMALSQGIGEIQQLRVDKQERQATILFKSVASAHAFYKKYQRRILDDLSVIEVKLEPML